MGVCRWYAERADVMLLFFDPGKRKTTIIFTALIQSPPLLTQTRVYICIYIFIYIYIYMYIYIYVHMGVCRWCAERADVMLLFFDPGIAQICIYIYTCIYIYIHIYICIYIYKFSFFFLALILYYTQEGTITMINHL
jgi:hypothetical protein